ncbi:hypothetical protein NMG60_11001170 [Bertholletia excelsa]
MKSGTLDSWRTYFRSSSSDIFEIIEHAIMVAASDYPQEFRLRRDRIAETLFSCKSTRCLGCNRVELVDNEVEGCKSGLDREGGEFELKESKVNSCGDDQVATINPNQVSAYSYGEAEALTDEIEEERQTVGEVLRIKEILDNSKDESDSVLFDSLRRLELLALSVDILKATEIGKSVNILRKHGSKQIRNLARSLIELWKDMVDEWVNATAAIAESTPESVNPSTVDEEEGLPSPPLDEGVFFGTQPTSMELSQFFDGMDDYGNPRNNGEMTKNQENSIKQCGENQNAPKRKQQIPREACVPLKDKEGELMKKPPTMKKQTVAVVKPNKQSNTESGPGRPMNINVESMGCNTKNIQQKQKLDKATIQKKPFAAPQDKLNLDDAARLEAAKRKLHERYQQAENAKRQRTIQVMELHDLPKQGVGHRNPHMRAGNHNRHWANGHR